MTSKSSGYKNSRKLEDLKEKSELEEAFAGQLRVRGVPNPEREFKFHPARGWLADFAWPALKLIVEVEGGTYSGGRHTTGTGFEKDVEKYNAAVRLGYRLYRATSKTVKDESAADMIQEIFEESQHGVEHGGSDRGDRFGAARSWLSRSGIPGGEGGS